MLLLVSKLALTLCYLFKYFRRKKLLMSHKFKKIRGVHPDLNKNTANSPTLRFESFPKVQIPMSMHIGVPCSPLASKGDKVKIGQIIGDCESFMSVPIHASISGTVTAIKKVVGSSGSPVETVEIESDGLNEVHESVKPPLITDKKSFIKSIRDSGLVGLGGASFPTHVKLSPPKGKEADVLIINAAECEPYITTDYRLMIERSDEIIDGILITLKWMGIPKAIIGIEDNKKDAAEILNYHINKSNAKDCISIKLLKTIYPQGAEKPLIYMTTGRVIPTGGLPHDIHTLVLNVATIRYISRYIRSGMPLVRKHLTLDGDAVAKPCNVTAPIGSFILDIIDKVGGVNQSPSKVIMGGPMMGVALDRTSVGIIKANNAILFFSSDSATIPEESPCIRCSRCVDVCPMDLLPTSIDVASRAEDIEELKKFNAMDCIECGACSYICPANRYLVQSIRIGKQFLRDDTKAKQ